MAIDLNRLSSAVDRNVSDSSVKLVHSRKVSPTKSGRVADSVKARAKAMRRQLIQERRRKQDSKIKRRPRRLTDSRLYRTVKRRVKDALEDTTTTEEAIEAVEQIVQDQPADLVVPAVVEVLGETVDLLEEAVGNSSLEVDTDFDEDGKEDSEELAEGESISDSVDHTAIVRKAFEQLPYDKRYLSYKQLEMDDNNYYVTFIDPTPGAPGEQNETEVVTVPISDIGDINPDRYTGPYVIGDWYEDDSIEGIISEVNYKGDNLVVTVDVQDETGNINPVEIEVPQRSN